MAEREPSQITLTVFAARDLQSKRKGEICQASVVFGLGKSQYITEVIESNNPEWNQEAIISVLARNQTQIVKFKVRDKDSVLGVVLLSLTGLGSQREASKRWLSLTSHKKGHDASGELLVECFVSRYRPGHVVSLSEASSPVLSRMGSQEDILHLGPKRGRRFSLHRRTPSWNKVSADVPSDRNLGSEASALTKQVSAETTASIHSVSSTASEISTKPQVTGISPHEGLVQGGQRVVLRGTNLGESKESIVKVMLADMDCTDSVEYFSPSKLAVTTPPRHAPSRGHVQVETVNGGVGVSSVEFAFVEREVAAPPEVSGLSPREGSVGGGQRVVLRGNNLGECKEGVVRVVIADVDCTESLEYFSPDKLVVTTLPRPSPGSGEVLVETMRGGCSRSSLTFTYLPGEPPLAERAHSHTHSSTGSTGNQKKTVQNLQHEVDQAELKLLRQQIKDLKDNNLHLRERNHALMGYIDTLLLTIIESKPDILEVKPFQSHSSNENSSVKV